MRLTDELPTSEDQIFTGGQLLGAFSGPGTKGQIIRVEGSARTGRYALIQMNNWDCLNFHEVEAFGSVSSSLFTLVNLTPVCCCNLLPSLWTSGSGTPPPILTEIIEVIVAWIFTLISACHSVRNLFKFSLFQTKKRESTSYYDCVKRLIPSLFKGTTLSVRSSCYLSCSHRIKRSNGRFSTLA